MNQPPLNPDALDKAALAMCHYVVANREMGHGIRPVYHQYQSAKAAVTAYLAAALPEVTSVEELDQLPIGSAVLSEKYIAQQENEEYPCVFQKLYTGDWHRGGRSSDTHPDYFLPARVLYRPEVNDA